MNGVAEPRQSPTTVQEWRCTECRSMLGLLLGHEVRFTFRKAEAIAHLPARRECPRCGHLNMIGAQVDIGYAIA